MEESSGQLLRRASSLTHQGNNNPWTHNSDLPKTLLYCTHDTSKITMMRSGSAMLTLLAVLFSSLLVQSTMAFGTTATRRAPFKMMPVATPTREKTDRKTGRKTGQDSDTSRRNSGPGEGFQWRRDGDLEYLLDSAESREDDDPFHILLMGATFDKPKITVPYVSSSLEYVLEMPPLEAEELTQFAHDEGMSCLGTWERKECLSLAKQIQMRDIVCRVVPYAEGGQRGWQAKDAGNAASSGSGASSSGASDSWN